MRTVTAAIACTLLVAVSGCAWMDWFSQTADVTRSEEMPQEIGVAEQPGGVAAPPIGRLPPTRPDPAPAARHAAGPNGQGAPWPLSLPEAVRIGLANSDVVRVLDGGVFASPTTAYDPAIAAAQARAALAAFDPLLSANGYAAWIDQPPDSFFGPGIPYPNQRNQGGATFSLTKPWISGGQTFLTYNTLGFLYVPGGTSAINPLNNTGLNLGLQQPLLRGAGFAVNKAPLRIACLRADQTELGFKQQVMALIRSINQAYWELHAARTVLAAREELLPRMEEVVRIEKARFEAQRSVRADVAKAEAQLHLIRQQWQEARSAVIEKELNLRNLLGIPPADGQTIVVVSAPMQAPLTVDPISSLGTALAFRPDWIQQRLSVRARELQLLVARNNLWPQLDANGTYNLSGLGENLRDATSQMTTWDYIDWQTGMTLSVPLGRRAARAGARAAEFQLAKEQALLRQKRHAIAYELSNLARQLDYVRREYQEASERLEGIREWVHGARLRYQFPPPAGEQQDWLLLALNDYLNALRMQSDAAADAAFLLAQYDTLIVRWEEALGTLLTESNVQLANCGTLQRLPPTSAPAIVPAKAPRSPPETVPAPVPDAKIGPPDAPDPKLASAAS